MKASGSKLTLVEKSSYGVAGLGNGIVRNMIPLYLLFYYTDMVGLNPAFISLAMMIGNIWDAVTDPVMGFISDHTQSRFGRRRIYLLYGAIPLGLLVFLTWSPPSAFSGFSLFVYVAVVIIFLRTNYTVVAVPHLALGAEMSADPNERSSVFGFNFAFGMFGEILGGVLPHLAIEFSDDLIRILHDRAGLFSDEFTSRALAYFGQPMNSFKCIAAIFGIIITSSVLATFFGTRERVLHEPERKDPETGNVLGALYRDLFDTLKNRPFLILLLAMMTIDIGSGITASMMMFVAKYWLKMEGLVSAFLVVHIMFAMGSAVFWVQFSKRTSKKITYLLGQTILTIGLLGTFFMVEGKPLLVFMLMAFSGFGAGAYVMLWSLIADRVDYDEYISHKRREGAYYGIFTLFSKSSKGVGLFLAGLCLKVIGFEKGVTMTPQTLFYMKMLFGPIAAFINLAGVIIFCFFHYNKKEHESIQAELARRKESLGDSPGS